MYAKDLTGLSVFTNIDIKRQLQTKEEAMKKVELKTITAPKIKVAEFHGDKIEGVKVIVGGKPKVYLLFRRLCENLGLSYGYQTITLKKLAEEFGEGCVSIIKTRDTIGREQKQLAIELDFLPTYLLTIDTNRVKPEIREKLRLYKREAKEVLARYFLSEGAASPEATQLFQLATQNALISLLQEVRELKEEVRRLKLKDSYSERYRNPRQEPLSPLHSHPKWEEIRMELRHLLQEGYSASKVQKWLFAQYGIVVSQKAICMYRNWWFNQMKDIWLKHNISPRGFIKWLNRKNKEKDLAYYHSLPD